MYSIFGGALKLSLFSCLSSRKSYMCLINGDCASKSSTTTSWNWRLFDTSSFIAGRIKFFWWGCSVCEYPLWLRQSCRNSQIEIGRICCSSRKFMIRPKIPAFALLKSDEVLISGRSYSPWRQRCLGESGSGILPAKLAFNPIFDGSLSQMRWEFARLL